MDASYTFGYTGIDLKPSKTTNHAQFVCLGLFQQFKQNINNLNNDFHTLKKLKNIPRPK
jgi:hypothetical protein